ncbi:MAG: long-chain fatty acid--CoA ligase [Lentimicrobiaceae bacterium]|nr:long-chain fatty acid--CoA ligase [Lentimicrobiaceae bacterium]
MQKVTRIFDILTRYATLYPDKGDAIAGKENGQWIKYSISEYIENANYISAALLTLGIQKGDTIATISSNKPEWNIVDMGILQIGAVHVPIYPTISESDYKFILGHSEVQYIFISGKDIFRKIEHILPEIPSIKGVFAFKETDGTTPYQECIELGKKSLNLPQLENIKSEIQSSDIATIIYTSGTTGRQKGVMLTHNNLISNFTASARIPYFLDHTSKTVSYLPLCHVYERMLNYVFQYLGMPVYYVESTATISENLKEVQPSIMSTVPRLIEKIYDKIYNGGRKLKGIKKMIFFWALRIALRYELDGANGTLYETKRKIADKLVYSKWREAFGNKLKIIVSGGAALQPRLSRVFWAAGVWIIEGYGLTETSPVIAVNNFWDKGVKFGTVGPALQGVQIKINDDGEILCKGENVMKGYFKEPALTLEVIDSDGWFHTGDIGHIEPEGQLKITGRKKEIFKTSLGKYISPELIENKFKESRFIDTIMVIGENQKFAAALIVPDFAHLQSWCAIKEIPYTTNAEMVNHPRIKQRFQKEINKYNKFFGATEQIKRYELMPSEWSIESSELTASLKLKRNAICSKYKPVIDAIFNIESGE